MKIMQHSTELNLCLLFCGVGL